MHSELLRVPLQHNQSQRFTLQSAQVYASIAVKG